MGATGPPASTTFGITAERVGQPDRWGTNSLEFKLVWDETGDVVEAGDDRYAVGAAYAPSLQYAGRNPAPEPSTPYSFDGSRSL